VLERNNLKNRLTMKKLIYTLLAVSIIFSACKKEDDEPTNSANSNGLVEYDVNCSPNGIFNLSYINSNGITIDTVINNDWDLSFNGISGDSVGLILSPQNPIISSLELKIYYLGILKITSSSSGSSTTTAYVIL